MKITIWIHKSEAISGKITNYSFTRPYHDRNEEWVEVQITQDAFATLEDKEPMIHERNPDTGEIKSREFMNHDESYHDYTRNMTNDQIETFDKSYDKVIQELKDWFSGLSPIHQGKIGNTYGMFFNTFKNKI